MAEVLKERYNETFVKQLCDEFKSVHPEFAEKKFTQLIFDQEWESKELKTRMEHISQCLYEVLPKNYSDALDIMKPVSMKFGGFEPMFFPDYVEKFGKENFDLSLDALLHFTKYSSSEFAVRPLVLEKPDEMMAQMKLWAKHENYHVRRLASEGCRPRLPWAIALPKFKKDPSPILPVLEMLMEDESDYVRRSVANNLNDISKDNPQVVIQIARRWLGKNQLTDRLIKHGCRTLLKQGNPDVLAMFGFSDPKDIRVEQFKIPGKVASGGKLTFSFSLYSDNNLGSLRVEFFIGFMKANGKQNKKVFKISEGLVESQVKHIEKNFSFAPISTRKYYSGEHSLGVIVNGVTLAEKTFILQS